MTYSKFKSKINGIISSSGIDVDVRYLTDSNGRFFANCSDGTTITACNGCKRVEVRWGSGHKSLATI